MNAVLAQPVRRDLLTLSEVGRGRREAEMLDDEFKLLDEFGVSRVDSSSVSSEHAPCVFGDEIDLDVVLVA